MGFFLSIYMVEQLGLSKGDAGFIMVLAYIAWHFKFFIGLLMDATPPVGTWRRRVYVLAGRILTVAGVLMLMGARDPWTEVFPAALLVFSSDAVVDIAADALLLDVAPPEYHGLGFGMGWSGRAIGYVVASLISGLAMEAYGWETSLALYVLYSLPALIVLAVREPPVIEERKISKRVIGETFTDPALLVVYLFAIFGASIYTLDPNRGILPLVVRECMGGAKYDVWAVAAVFGIGAAVGSPLTGRLADLIEHKRAYFISLAGAVATVAAWAFAPPNPTLVYVLLFVMGFFEGFNFTVWEALLGDSCPPEFPAFMFQYFMSALHVTAFVLGVVVSSGMGIMGLRGTMLLAAGYLAIGFIPAALLKPVRTGKVARLMEGE